MLFQVVIENGVKKIQALTADTGAGAPVGSFIYMYKKSSPSGYLYCDGSTFDQTKYPALYQYLGSNVLPDYRECVAVGAEQNTTDTIASHDVYTEGQFKDDQIQDHNHLVDSSNSAGVNGIGVEGANRIGAFLTDSAQNARIGTTTHGKQKAVYIYIKATSGLTENQQENVLNTINENLSYSTTEHKTGKKWIDGRDIWSATIIGVISSESMDVAHNIANIDKVTNAQGFAEDSGSNVPSGFYATPEYFFSMAGDRTQYHIRTTTNYINMAFNLTLEYTKTTDN